MQNGYRIRSPRDDLPFNFTFFLQWASTSYFTRYPRVTLTEPFMALPHPGTSADCVLYRRRFIKLCFNCSVLSVFAYFPQLWVYWFLFFFYSRSESLYDVRFWQVRFFFLMDHSWSNWRPFQFTLLKMFADSNSWITAKMNGFLFVDEWHKGKRSLVFTFWLNGSSLNNCDE